MTDRAQKEDLTSNTSRGCVTQSMLKKIKSSGGARAVLGFASLSVEDQHRVLAAVSGTEQPPSRPLSITQNRAILPNVPTVTQIGSGSATTSQKRKRESQPDIIEISDSGSEGEPATKKRAASTSQVQTVAVSAQTQPTASSSFAFPGLSLGALSRPSALIALNALATRTTVAPEPGPEDQEPAETGMYGAEDRGPSLIRCR